MDVHKYPIIIKETNLDLYGHVNNATYFIFFEDARWNLINTHGYGYEKIMETGFGPVILEASIKYLRELRLHDNIIIETHTGEYTGKICKMHQKMMREEKVCCTAEFTFALFDLKHRKLVEPTQEWLNAIGLQDLPLQ